MRPTGLLLDLDGTLYVGEAALAGAVAAVSTLAQRAVPRRYLTNTTRVSRRALAARLQGMGFPIVEEEIFTAPLAAARWLRENGLRRVALYVPQAVHEDFSDFELVDTAPEAVVVGDLGEAWTYARLNAAFRQVMDGAKLVALQKNRSWQTVDGLAMDAGPFVAALEYATRREALVVGKPSPLFFESARATLGLSAEQVAVVGDDVESDVGGAHTAGLKGALVRTGKFRLEALSEAGIRPDWVADSIGDLVEEWYP